MRSVEDEALSKDTISLAARLGARISSLCSRSVRPTWPDEILADLCLCRISGTAYAGRDFLVTVRGARDHLILMRDNRVLSRTADAEQMMILFEKDLMEELGALEEKIKDVCFNVLSSLGYPLLSRADFPGWDLMVAEAKAEATKAVVQSINTPAVGAELRRLSGTAVSSCMNFTSEEMESARKRADREDAHRLLQEAISRATGVLTDSEMEAVFNASRVRLVMES